MLLSSLLIIEVVVVLSWINRQQGSPVLDFRDTMRIEVIEVELRGVDTVPLKCAGLLHIFTLLCIMVDLWPNSGTAPKNTFGNSSYLAAKIGVCGMKIF